MLLDKISRALTRIFEAGPPALSLVCLVVILAGAMAIQHGVFR